jgi:hypothetical protein
MTNYIYSKDKEIIGELTPENKIKFYALAGSSWDWSEQGTGKDKVRIGTPKKGIESDNETDFPSPQNTIRPDLDKLSLSELLTGSRRFRR